MVDELNMKRVPERRFPKFKNDGEWEESLFAESFDFLPNNTLSRADLNYNAGVVRNVHYGDVLIKFGNCLDVKECNLPFITNEKVTEKISQSKLKNGDVVIADTAEDEMVGKCSEIINLTDEIVVSGLHTIPIRPISQFAPFFLGFYLNSESYRRQLIPLMQGIKVVALSKGAFSKTKILYPKNLAEQKKIADSLSFLDGSISLVKKKLELLKLQKKGLMQKLFPAQGEKIPKYRFKEFENDGGWVESDFDKIFVFLPNNTLSRADLNYNDGIVRNVHYGDILIKFGNCLDVKKNNLPFITNEKVTGKISQSKLKNGDVVIADTAEDEMVGKCSEIISLTDEIVVSGLHTIPVRPIYSFASLFLGYYLNSESYRRQLIPLMQGVKVVALSKGALSKTKVLYPKNFNEQKKIANSLSLLDDSISFITKKLELLESSKKGLMQQLFP